MRILIIDTYYKEFFREFYAANPAVVTLPYPAHWRALMDKCFGTADFYSTNLAKLGQEATEIVADCEPLQRQWAQERGLELSPSRTRLALTRRRGVPWLRRVSDDAWLYTVLRAQIQEYQPDVLYVQDMHNIRSDFLQEVKSRVRLLVGQIASPYASHADFRPYDLILTSFPHFVERFRRQGLRSEYFRLGFEPSLLGRLTKTTPHPVVFVGGLSAQHSERTELLEAIATAQPLDIWGYGIETTRYNSPLRRDYHGSAWGLDMYSRLSNGQIALNHHINAAEQNANNMRLYEATGVGTLLITDAKQNLHTLFEPGKEVVTYDSAEECRERIGHYLAHPQERESIAAAGQSRTLKEHTFFHRMQELIVTLQGKM